MKTSKKWRKPLFRQTEARGRRQSLRPRAFQDASRPAAAVRKGRCAWPPRRLPSTPLLTGLPPRCIRHWRRSAPAVRKGRCAWPPRRLPSTPLLTGLPPRFFRHWRRSAPPPLPPGFPPTPKRQRKSQAFRPTRPRPVHRPEKGGSDREPLRGRLQPSRRAERGFFRGHGAGAVCSGFAALLPPGAAEEGARSRCLRRPTTTMPGGSRAVKTGRTRPCPMPHWSRDGMSEAPVKELYRGRADGVRGDEGPGGINRPAAGYRRRAASPAVARISPCA